jgi:hypothetical protein
MIYENNGYTQLPKAIREAERICDGIIQYHNNSLDERDREHIRSRIELGKFSMNEKITKVEKIIRNEGSDSGQEFLNYLKLLNEIRNKFMFHFLDNDEYLFLYSEEKRAEKDQNLRKILQCILDKTNEVLGSLNAEDEEKRIIEVYAKTMEKVIKLLDEIDYPPDTHTSTSIFYRDFSEYFTYISYAFIFFLGRENLKLFK